MGLEDNYHLENPSIINAVEIINCLARDNTDLFSEAFKVWRSDHNIGPAQAVAIARQNLYGDKNQYHEA